VPFLIEEKQADNFAKDEDDLAMRRDVLND